MSKKITEQDVKNMPNGGAVIGKRDGQTIIHNDASIGGYFAGKRHSEGGIKAVVKTTGQPIEVETDEIIINRKSVADPRIKSYTGTNKEILSDMNSENGNGVAFADGGPVNVKLTQQLINEGKTQPVYNNNGVITGYEALPNSQQGSQQSSQESSALDVVEKNQELLMKDGGEVDDNSLEKEMSKYGWSVENKLGVVYVFNTNNKIVMVIKEKKGKYVITDAADNKLLSGNKNLPQAASKVATQYYYAKEIDKKEEGGKVDTPITQEMINEGKKQAIYDKEGHIIGYKSLPKENSSDDESVEFAKEHPGVLLYMAKGGSVEESYRELLVIPKPEALLIIKNALDKDYFFELDGRSLDILSKNVFDLFLYCFEHNKSRPYISKFGDSIIFEPDKRLIESQKTYLLALIKYAAHFFTEEVFVTDQGRRVRKRALDTSKSDNFNLLTETIINPDKKLSKSDKPNRMYYFKYVENNNTLVCFNICVEDGVIVEDHVFLEAVTFMPDKSKIWLESQIASGKYNDLTDAIELLLPQTLLQGDHVGANQNDTIDLTKIPIDQSKVDELINKYKKKFMDGGKIDGEYKNVDENTNLYQHNLTSDQALLAIHREKHDGNSSMYRVRKQLERGGELKADPVVMNFTKFAVKNGYPSDYDILEHGILGPSGHMSKRSKDHQMDLMLKRGEANRKAHLEYESAIGRGEIIDSDGKITKQTIFIDSVKDHNKKVQSKIDMYSNRIKQIEGLGRMSHMESGKLKPKWQREFDGLVKERSEYEKQLKSLDDTLVKGGSVPSKKIKLIDIPALLQPFLPTIQQKALLGTTEHWETLDRIEDIIKEMPSTKQSAPKIDDKIIYLHYFYANNDWYIAEKDMYKDQKQAFGYAIIDGDLSNAEWGYISLEELNATKKVELDLFFDPVKFGELKKQWVKESVNSADMPMDVFIDKEALANSLKVYNDSSTYQKASLIVRVKENVKILESLIDSLKERDGFFTLKGEIIDNVSSLKTKLAMSKVFLKEVSNENKDA